MFKNIFAYALIWVSFFPSATYAQDDLQRLLEDSLVERRTPVIATFKGTRLINGQTVETIGANSLDFRISHRFGVVKTNKLETLQESANTFFGLDDDANVNLSLDYCVNGKLVVGLARNTIGKLVEVYTKYKLLSQTEKNEIPVSAALLWKGGYLSDMALQGISGYSNNQNRMMYLFELMVARKFSQRLSLQISPMFIHYNYADRDGQTFNDLYAAMASFRFKLTKSTALTSEYSQVFNHYFDPNQEQNGSAYIPTFSIGFDLETGGHVFQVFCSNSVAISEFQYVGFNNNDWGVGQVCLGFNISRTFGLKKRK